MKHMKALTRKPEMAQTGLQTKADFLVRFTEQVVMMVFNKTD